MHHKRMIRNGTLELTRKSPEKNAICSVSGCDRPYLANSFCNLHYLRVKKSGTTELVDKPIQWCSELGCEVQAYARGFCESHYSIARSWEPRVCKTCGRTQPEVQFQGYRKQCNACTYSKNKDSNRDRNLRRLYGISTNEYGTMLKDQNNGCAICKTHTPGGNGDFFHVDHNHTTGKVRGLLCAPCNLAIGHLNENPTTARQVALYLEGHDSI